MNGDAGRLVPVEDVRKGMRWARRDGAVTALLYLGGLALLCAYAWWEKAPDLRVYRVEGGGGGGEEKPPTMRERAAQGGGTPPADALPN